VSQYLQDPNYPSIGPAPVKNETLNLIAKLLRSGKGLANNVELPEWVPMVGGEGLGDLVLGQAPQEIEQWSYGNSPFVKESVIPMLKPNRRDSFADTAMLGIDLIPGATPATRALRGMPVGLSTKDVGDNTLEELAKREVAAPKQTNRKARYQSGNQKGTYVGSGAFGGITPQKAASMRSKYLDKVKRGVEGRLWYDKTSADIFRLVGENPQKADAMANALAITSSSTPVGSNMMMGAKGWNQYAVGDPMNTGKYPTRMSAQMLEAFEDPEASASGLKRGPFSAGLSVAWRGEDFVNRATHDIHDARAYGIRDPKTGRLWDKGIGEAGHRFLDDQADRVTQEANARALGGVTDWKPYRAQAASWISQKAETDGVPIEQAAKHYGDYINDYSGQVTREWVPGDNTKHMAELLRASPETRAQYSDDMEQVVRGPQGIDRLASEMGALSDRVIDNRGVYEGATNKGYASIIPVGKKTGADEIDPSSAKLLDSVAAAHGLLGVQKQSAWNFAAGKSPIKNAGQYQIRTGTPFTEQELADLNDLTNQYGADIPQVDPRGARILEFGPEGDPGRKALVSALRKKYPQAEISTQANSGNLFPADDSMNAPENWSAKPYIEKIEAAGPRVVEGFDRAAQQMAPELLAKANEWSAKNGFTQAEWYRPMMEGLAQGGIARLKELVKQGVVPVVALSALGLSQLDEDPPQSY